MEPRTGDPSKPRSHAPRRSARLGAGWLLRRRRQDRAHNALLQISEATQSAPSLHDLFQRIHTIIAQLLPARNLYIAVYDEAAGELSFPYFVDEMDPRPPPRKLGNGITELVLRSGRPLLLGPRDIEALRADGTIRVRGVRPLDWLGVPLLGAQGPFGVLAIETYASEVRYTPKDTELLQFVSTQIAASILRKRAEETIQAVNQRLALNFQQTPLGMIEWDLDFRVALWNPAAERIFGYTAEEARGRQAGFIIPPADRDAVAAVWQDLLAGRGGQRTSSPNLRKDGAFIQCEWYHTPVRDAEDRLVSLSSLVEDVTERRRIDGENLKLQAQLQQAQKMESLGALAGGVAHDMNNVLGAILGMAEANLEAHPADSRTYQAFEIIIRAATRGGELVKGLLSFARRSPAEERTLELNGLLTEEAQLLERTLPAQVRLELDLDPGLWPILGEASALSHAFMNLCVNAVDAMPAGGTLTLRTSRVDEDWVEVQIVDTGLGMPRDVLDKALDPFFTTKEVGKGTGLGLAMVYNTVKAHKGQLLIQSEPGQGTLVRMRFPAQVGLPPIAPPASAPPRARAATRALEVLVVDDDELIQCTLEAILAELGHRASVVPCGEEALALLEAGSQPQVVILDMNMPGLGGAGTLPRLRALRPDLPVLLSTGRVDQTALDLAAAYPGVTFMPKPLHIGELRTFLEAQGQAGPETA